MEQPFEISKDGSLQLIGGRNSLTNEYLFPFRNHREDAGVERCLLPTTGELWTYTIQRVPPKNPPYLGITDPTLFEPYAVGYIQLGETILVEARLVGDLASLRPGLPMQCVALDIPTPDGGSFRTFGFQPAERPCDE